ncbi:MAG: response regulator [Deltaproteobacteria bacterium]|nr:response regulator [Deltaproteobacteria bacterium]
MADTILVVDDNENATRMTARMLSGLGFEVTTALDGPSALSQIAERHPDCILLDVMMPRMSGLEVLSRLKRDPATTAIPVILLTAKSQDEDVLTGYREGAEYYLTKPCTTRDLAYGIRLVLGNRRPQGASASG